jgi:parallel beta-helix repeat protein
MVNDGVYNSISDQVKVTFVAPKIIVSGTMQPGTGYKLYRKIQHAVDSSASGDTVFIDNGVYAENVRCLGKSNFSLIGLSKAGVIVDGNGHTPKGSTLRIDSASNGITIKNMTFKNGGITDPANIDVAGILCYFATNVVLENDSVVLNYGDGIRLFISGNILIQSCTIANNAYSGIKGTSSSFTTKSSRIINNGTSKSINAWGIFLDCETILSQSISATDGNVFNNPGMEQIHINDSRFTGAQYSLTIRGNSFAGGSNGIVCEGNPVFIVDPLTNNTFSGISGSSVSCP